MPKRGPKPKPTALQLIRGNPGKRPIRKIPAKPRTAIPRPPAFISKVAKEEWRRVAKFLTDLGVLTPLDRATLAAYCQSYSRWVEAEQAIAEVAKKDPTTMGLTVRTAHGSMKPSALVSISHTAMANMLKFAAEFGMTPSSRATVMPDVDPSNSPKPNPWSGTLPPPPHPHSS